ncbi:PREDICTED: uncharacterized protein LOC105153727, partial [Acromyrmex echinatior]|uniref:uncharacterized protein LOC105153727 n=1 Tax=Acromyrmex echinatior TaxID=103372 RepID=UPI000580C9CD
NSNRKVGLFNFLVPELQLIPCMCHSLHLAASQASDELSSSLEFLIRETNSWFSCSPLRKSLYNSLYATINEEAMNSLMENKCYMARGDHPFNELAIFALRILCLPFSNVAVECVFSHMNTIKTKPRNRLEFNMLVALLRIRIHLVVIDKCCCKDFEITEKMLKLFTSAIYETVNSRDVSCSANNIEKENAFEEGLTLFRDASDEN